jgi:superfamily II DNA helicase RecQ
LSLSSEDEARAAARVPNAASPDSSESEANSNPGTAPSNGATFEDGVPTIVIRRSADAEEDAVADRPPGPISAPGLVDAAPAAPPSPALERALEKMRSVFHIRELRPGQAEIMESVLAGRDTLAIMPTGSGKSLTYQLPALVLEGPSIVVSPLLALIEDQYIKLKAAGIAVVRIDSRAPQRARRRSRAAVREGTSGSSDDHARVGELARAVRRRSKG